MNLTLEKPQHLDLTLGVYRLIFQDARPISFSFFLYLVYSTVFLRSVLNFFKRFNFCNAIILLNIQPLNDLSYYIYIKAICDWLTHWVNDWVSCRTTKPMLMILAWELHFGLGSDSKIYFFKNLKNWLYSTQICVFFL